MTEKFKGHDSGGARVQEAAGLRWRGVCSASPVTGWGSGRLPLTRVSGSETSTPPVSWRAEREKPAWVQASHLIRPLLGEPPRPAQKNKLGQTRGKQQHEIFNVSVESFYQRSSAEVTWQAPLAQVYGRRTGEPRLGFQKNT